MFGEPQSPKQQSMGSVPSPTSAHEKAQEAWFDYIAVLRSASALSQLGSVVGTATTLILATAQIFTDYTS